MCVPLLYNWPFGLVHLIGIYGVIPVSYLSCDLYGDDGCYLPSYPFEGYTHRSLIRATVSTINARPP
jgi:hypothetical protein